MASQFQRGTRGTPEEDRAGARHSLLTSFATEVPLFRQMIQQGFARHYFILRAPSGLRLPRAVSSYREEVMRHVRSHSFHRGRSEVHHHEQSNPSLPHGSAMPLQTLSIHSHLLMGSEDPSRCKPVRNVNGCSLDVRHGASRDWAWRWSNVGVSYQGYISMSLEEPSPQWV